MALEAFFLLLIYISKEKNNSVNHVCLKKIWFHFKTLESVLTQVIVVEAVLLLCSTIVVNMEKGQL